MRTVRTSRAATAALVTTFGALAVTALAACGPSTANPTTSERFVATVQAAAEGGTLAMTSVTHFDWDHGVFVCPADAVADVSTALDATWPDGKPPADGAAYALFASAGKVVDTLSIDRSTVDPCAGPTLDSRTFGPTSDFTVEAADGGWILTRAG